MRYSWIVIAMAWLLLGCNLRKVSLTASEMLPPFIVSSPDGWPVTAEMGASATSIWAAVGGCLSITINPPPGYPIHVHSDMISCGGVPAWGCFNGPMIEVTGAVYDMSLRHEMTHLALYLAGRDYGEGAADMLRCEK